jgi:hypothetical protein
VVLFIPEGAGTCHQLGVCARSFQDHEMSLRILKGRSMARVAQRVVSVMSRRPVRRMAPMARLPVD